MLNKKIHFNQIIKVCQMNMSLPCIGPHTKSPITNDVGLSKQNKTNTTKDIKTISIILFGLKAFICSECGDGKWQA